MPGKQKHETQDKKAIYPFITSEAEECINFNGFYSSLVILFPKYIYYIHSIRETKVHLLKCICKRKKTLI